MDFSADIKVEDQKVVIDLDYHNSSEDIVVDWHLEMRRFFSCNTVGDNKLEEIMKEYIKSITERAIHFEDVETLKGMVEKHIEHIYWLFRDLDLCFSDTYLDHMEQIMTFYLNLTLRSLLALKKKTKITQKIMQGLTEKIVKKISCYLLDSEYHIFHVLIKQTIASMDDLVKDVLNILKSNICKQLFKNLYMHFLVLCPVKDTSDEAFCRAYILFENWKALEDHKQNEEIEELMRNLFGRDSECIRENKFLTDILQPKASVIGELLKEVACNPSITSAYFGFIKSRQKQELEILEDIEKLSFEDRGWQEDDDDDDEYIRLFDKMVGNKCKDSFSVKIGNNGEVKEEKKSPDVDEGEIICCSSDSDSDIEIVSIKPSSSYCRANNITQKLYIQTLKNSGTNKPHKTSFLDHVSMDTNSEEERFPLEKNSRPNPLSPLFCNTTRRETKTTAIPESSEVNEDVQQKQNCGNSCDISRKENAISNDRPSSLEIVASNEKSSTAKSACSSQVETLDASPKAQTNFGEGSKCAEDCNLLEENSTDSVSNHRDLKNAHSNGNLHSNNLQNESSKTVEDSCNHLVTGSEPTSIPDCPRMDSVKDPTSETSKLVYSNHSPEEPSITVDDSWKIQISKSDTSICSNPEIQQSKVETVSPLVNGSDPKTKTSKSAESSECVMKGLTCQVEENVESVHLGNETSLQSNVDLCDMLKNTIITSSSNAATSTEGSVKKIVKNTTSSPSVESLTDSYGGKIVQDCNKDVILPKKTEIIDRLHHTNKIEDVGQTCPRVSNKKDVDTVFSLEEQQISNTANFTYSFQSLENVDYGTSVENLAPETNTPNSEDTKQVNLNPEERVCYLPDEQNNVQSKGQIDFESSLKTNNQSDEQSTVCEINTTEKTCPVAQSNDIIEPLQSQNGFLSANKHSCVELNKLAISCEKSVRRNGAQIFEKSGNNVAFSRKGQSRLLKRRNSDSAALDRQSVNRWEGDIDRDSAAFNSIINVKDQNGEAVNFSKDRVDVHAGVSTLLDTGQCVPPRPLDTGQARVIDGLSPAASNPCEEIVSDRAKLSDRKTSQHINSAKRTEPQPNKDELCGYPTPPGSEEDIDDTQPDPVYSNIFPKQSCSKTGDCSNGERTVFRLNSESERDVTVDENASSGQAVPQTRPAASRDEGSVEIVVPDIVYSEGTSSENDFFTQVIPSDPPITAEDAKLQSDGEKINQNDSGNENLAKSFAEIVKDAVGGDDCEEDSKRNITELNVTHKQSAITPSKKQVSFPTENIDHCEEMETFLKNNEKEYDINDSRKYTRDRRKRTFDELNAESTPHKRKKSPKSPRKSHKINTPIIPGETFDQFEANVWNQQSPITSFAYERDASYSGEEDTTTQDKISRSDGRTKVIRGTTISEKPSQLPLSERIRKNGSTIDLPLSTSTPKKPPLKGILKRDEHNHSYHPLHPIDDDAGSSYVYIQVQNPASVRGMLGSRIKVSRKSLNACKVSKNYKELFAHYPRVSLNHVWNNKELEWEKISDPSKRYLWDMMPQRLYRINYDKSTSDSLKYQVYFIDQSIKDESSMIVNTRNPNLEIGDASGTVNLSNEIVCIESTEPNPATTVQLHDAPISPCLSPSSNASSEFSDPTNLIPYQDIERALQVVEPDEQTCCGSSAIDVSVDRSDPSQRDSVHVLDNALVDNISAEAIKLLSNNADFHKIFCDFDGEILIENVPVLDADEAETILSVDGGFANPLPKVDVRLSDKLTDDLLLNLNSDVTLLRKVCNELGATSLADPPSNSLNNFENTNLKLPFNLSEDASRGALSSVDESKLPIPPEPNCNISFENTNSSESTAEREPIREKALSENSTISTKSDLKSNPSGEYISDDRQLCEHTDDQECANINYTNNFKTVDSNVTTTPYTQLSLVSNSDINKQVSNSTVVDNHYFRNARVNNQPFQKSQIYQTPQLTDQFFQNSRIGHPLICADPAESFIQNSQKHSLIVNVPMSPNSLRALSQKKSVAQMNIRTAQNALENFPPVHFGHANIANTSFYNSLNPLRDISVPIEPHRMEIIPATYLQGDVPSQADVHVNSAFRFSSESKPKATKRGRPRKNSKQLKGKTHPVVPSRVKQTADSNRYQERVPPIYHAELEPVKNHVGASHSLVKCQKHAVKGPRNGAKVANVSATGHEHGAATTNFYGKQKLLPMPVPETFNFETDTLKQELYNMRLESGKVDHTENDAEFETHLPLKKRKLSMPVPTTSSVSMPAATSKSNTLTSSSLEKIESNEISYPATPMLSIADVYIPMASRPFKTPGEKKQLPADPPPVPVRYDPPNDITPFTCSMNTFTSTVYRLNDCPYNVKLDCASSYCPPPPILFPPDSFSRTN